MNCLFLFHVMRSRLNCYFFVVLCNRFIYSSYNFMIFCQICAFFTFNFFQNCFLIFLYDSICRISIRNRFCTSILCCNIINRYCRRSCFCNRYGRCYIRQRRLICRISPISRCNLICTSIYRRLFTMVYRSIKLQP